ncbi:hypothetical protein [Corallococcus llansteffanensis]|uniref:hypothetical protein n=1 Tax=Corallococcus llansteffanensis TaxID=2316731 RepID=UPI001ABF3B29|nr:hypothetical protein [Corallococcus llansteffanensis]
MMKGPEALPLELRTRLQLDAPVPEAEAKAVLTRRDPNAKVLSVALLEVSPEAVKPQEYAALVDTAPLPYDYVWFTPAMPEDDPCKALRERKTPPGR